MDMKDSYYGILYGSVATVYCTVYSSYSTVVGIKFLYCTVELYKYI